MYLGIYLYTCLQKVSSHFSFLTFTSLQGVDLRLRQDLSKPQPLNLQRDIAWESGLWTRNLGSEEIILGGG